MQFKVDWISKFKNNMNKCLIWMINKTKKTKSASSRAALLSNVKNCKYKR